MFYLPHCSGTAVSFATVTTSVGVATNIIFVAAVNIKEAASLALTALFVIAAAFPNSKKKLQCLLHGNQSCFHHHSASINSYTRVSDVPNFAIGNHAFPIQTLIVDEEEECAAACRDYFDTVERMRCTVFGMLQEYCWRGNLVC